jgi:hypothetical protein
MTWIVELRNNRSHVTKEIYYRETLCVILNVKLLLTIKPSHIYAFST